jgi:ABC-type uncharacterized transport system permease subunit
LNKLELAWIFLVTLGPPLFVGIFFAKLGGINIINSLKEIPDLLMQKGD